MYVYNGRSNDVTPFHCIVAERLIRNEWGWQHSSFLSLVCNIVCTARRSRPETPPCVNMPSKTRALCLCYIRLTRIAALYILSRLSYILLKRISTRPNRIYGLLFDREREREIERLTISLRVLQFDSHYMRHAIQFHFFTIV